jgi:hypothetical protein
MPPVGGEPVFPHFEPKVKKVRIRRKKIKQNEVQGARSDEQGAEARIETDTAGAAQQK